MHCALALLGDAPPGPSLAEELLAALGGELSGLIVAGPELEPLLAVAPRQARLVASLHPPAGLLGALQSALLVCAAPALLAVDARQAPAVDELRQLLSDPRPGKALVFRRHGELRPLPGRFRRTCLAPLSRALLEGERQLAPVLRRLRCSSLEWP